MCAVDFADYVQDEAGADENACGPAVSSVKRGKERRVLLCGGFS